MGHGMPQDDQRWVELVRGRLVNGGTILGKHVLVRNLRLEMSNSVPPFRCGGDVPDGPKRFVPVCLRARVTCVIEDVKIHELGWDPGREFSVRDFARITVKQKKNHMESQSNLLIP